MRVLITGATGFIGRVLCARLCRDYEVIALSCDAKRAAESLAALATVLEWDARTLGNIWAF
jgi:nucleoside-diphosphate-sugar epimerase